jgi:hypothetical protein
VSYRAFKNGSPLVIRLGTEANGYWETDYVGGTSAEAADWAKCYDNEVTAMKAVAGTDFLFIWNPNACFSSAADAPGLSAWYPGNDDVSIIGADAYDTDCTNDETVAQEGWAAFASAGDPALDSIEAFAAAHGKPMALPEWGLEPGKDDPAYVDGIGHMADSEDFAFQSYFDTGDASVATLGSDIPESTAAFRQEFAAPAAPAGLRVSGGTTAAISWKAVPGATKYNLLVLGAKARVLHNVTVTGTSLTMYLTPAGVRYFKVRAASAAAWGPYSSSVKYQN